VNVWMEPHFRSPVRPHTDDASERHVGVGAVSALFPRGTSRLDSPLGQYELARTCADGGDASEIDCPIGKYATAVYHRDSAGPVPAPVPPSGWK
jgi:hypothetical protein